MAGPTPEAPKQHRPAPGDLAQAVALIQQASAAAAVLPQPIAVKVDDGLNTQDAQLLLVRDADGGDGGPEPGEVPPAHPRRRGLLADAFTDLLGRVKEEAQVQVFVGTPEA